MRAQIRELEERQRDEKEEEIHRLFEKRIRAYEHKEFMPFDDFMCPMYANKSYSMNKVEQEMVDFLESREADYEALVVYSKNLKTPLEDLIIEYLELPEPDVSTVVNRHNEKLATKRDIKERIINDSKNRDGIEENFLIGFKEPKDYYKALYVLKEAGVDFYKTDIPGGDVQ